MPIGAYGGRADLMGLVAPAGPGLPGGHAVGPSAVDGGRASRRSRRSTPDATRTSRTSGAALEAGLADAAASAGREVAIARVGSLLTVFFRPTAPTDAAEALESDREAYARFFGSMLDQGMLLPPSPVRGVVPVDRPRAEIEIEATLDGRADGARASAA